MGHSPKDELKLASNYKKPICYGVGLLLNLKNPDDDDRQRQDGHHDPRKRVADDEHRSQNPEELEKYFSSTLKHCFLICILICRRAV